MDNSLLTLISVLIIAFPLIGAIISGLVGNELGRKMTHRILISLVGASFLLSCFLFQEMVLLGHSAVQSTLYTWGSVGQRVFEVGILLDRLSVTMMTIVLFVSLAVHIYTIGYMNDDEGYIRFFSYVSLFTFAMLTLVAANNCLVLFFGWEGVGLVSYLLIGFWFKRESANQGSLKAFLVNRVGDMAFLLGIAAIYLHFDSLQYSEIFNRIPDLMQSTVSLFPGYDISTFTLIAVLLFIGAMAKSAQVPLHVWLPESMEGPTPISALIHAATMVTAGIYMVARLSPIYEHSEIALSMMLILGGTTALFMGLLALVQNDIKRVIAYSTISQLGYMTVALGASAYDAAIFHLVTHAFFKALLFLAAGSVIIALHHEQDMRKMGGLARVLPVTYLTFIVGALALSAIPPFAGFYSKDIIIEAAGASHLFGATYAYYCVLFGAFFTAVYTFRAVFMTFHGKSRVDSKVMSHVSESPWVVLVPLVALAIPSLLAGQWLVTPMIFSMKPLLGGSIFVSPSHQVLSDLTIHYHGAVLMALDAGRTIPFWLSIAGIVVAWMCTLGFPARVMQFKNQFPRLISVLENKYGFDAMNDRLFVRGVKRLGTFFYLISDVKWIDGVMVNGSGQFVRSLSQLGRRLQTGYLYHAAWFMLLGILGSFVWLYVWG